MNQPLPFYAKTALILLMLWLLLYGVYIGQAILLPLGFSFLFAVLLRPVEKKILQWHIPRVPAILITLLLALAGLAGLLMLISTQVSSLVKDLPTMEKNLLALWHNGQDYVQRAFHVDVQKQQQMLQKAKDNTINGMGNTVTHLLGTLSTSLADVALIPIYTFFFLYYRDLLIRFITYAFEQRHAQKVSEIVGEVRTVVQHYITGVMTETACVAVLNTLGLLILGVPYAILLGLLAAILNIIPWIGGIIGALLTALIAYTNTGQVSMLVWVLLVHAAVQFIDNHFFVPYLIGSKVKLNALVSLIIVFVGGALCGIGGMFLSIPAIAICKVIFDRIDELRPWGLLLGDDTVKWIPRKTRRKVHRLQ